MHTIPAMDRACRVVAADGGGGPVGRRSGLLSSPTLAGESPATGEWAVEVTGGVVTLSARMGSVD